MFILFCIMATAFAISGKYTPSYKEEFRAENATYQKRALFWEKITFYSFVLNLLTICKLLVK